MTTTTLNVLNLAPGQDDLTQAVIDGLRQSPKVLPCRFFYDQRGSQLFDAICELPEYYPTRTEWGIMQKSVDEMARVIGSGRQVIELGSGSSTKTRILLEHLPAIDSYVPIDISYEHLLQASESVAEMFPSLEVLPVCADYLQPFTPPTALNHGAPRLIYFPGSTIGNFHRADVRPFFDRMAELAGPDGAVLIGVDLRKDPAILLPAYNDSQGVTAAFNLNLLHRINREAEASIDVEQFRHEARWNDQASRVEMHLVSTAAQTVAIDGAQFALDQEESIRTECSYKFELEELASLTDAFEIAHIWTDDKRYFSVQYLTRR